MAEVPPAFSFTEDLLTIRRRDSPEAQNERSVVRKRKRTAQHFSFYRQLPKFKRNHKRTSARAWRHKPFDSSTSGLHTWTKSADDPVVCVFECKEPQEKLKFTNTQYDRQCKTKAWSKQDSKLLTELAQTYNRRFVLVTDRFNQAMREQNRPTKTKEEIKQRFYEMQKILSTEYPRGREEKFKNFDFDIEKEQKRLESLEKLLSRTKEENDKYTQLAVARRKVDASLREKKLVLKKLRYRLEECNKFVKNRCQKNDITKDDLVLTLGGIYGYNCGYGTVIKDDLRRLPLPNRGILANFPKNAVVRCHRNLSAKITTAKQMMAAPVKYTANCGPGGTNIMMMHPLTDELEFQLGKNSTNYKCSIRADKLIDDVCQQHKVKAPSMLVAKLFDKLRADATSLVALEQLVMQKEKEYRQLQRLNEHAQLLSHCR